MNTFLARTNAVFAFALSILAALTFFCAMSTSYKKYGDVVPVKISTARESVRNLPNYQAGRETCDLGMLNFDLEADFTKAFDWNTKQLFLYLTAHYKTPANAINQVVLWDHILLRQPEAKLSLKNHNVKYYFWDDGHGLKNNPNVTLTLSMNVIPNAGMLPIFTVPTTHTFTFPNIYTN